MELRRILRRLLARRGAVAGAVLALALVLIAALGPALVHRDPLAADVDHGLTASGAPLPPSADAPLGTDQLGRDVWTRVVVGSRSSLAIATLATLLALAIGLAVGVLAGYAGGWTDHALMRLVDLVLAFPYLLLAILLASVLHGTALASSVAPVVITLAIVGWPTVARVVRGKALAIARSEHVAAARALGASPWRIAVHHVLPNLGGVAIALAVPALAGNLLAESVLSYVGLGPAPPTPSWGRMMYEGRMYYRSAPWLALAPGVAILVAVVAFHLLGDGLRDAIDPKDEHA
ncbi:MAG TPA: ABC transporter permease [Kofleriaceae bacterium]|nr:ABC transporter permease [Kofleriaceae bacterium]